MRSICDILKQSKTIAVIGLNNKPGRASGPIALFLKEKGYNVVGVNPTAESFGGIKMYKSLDEIDFDIDIVNVFRRSSAIPEIIPDVLKKKPKTLWLQSGIRNDDAVAPAIEAGIEVIQDACIAVEYRFCP
jgi:uncharacterized protein